MVPISGLRVFGVYPNDFQNTLETQQAEHTTPSHSHKAPPLTPRRVIKQKIQNAAGQQVREHDEEEDDDEGMQGLGKELGGLLESVRQLDPRTAEGLRDDPEFQSALESLGEDERKQLQNALQKEDKHTTSPRTSTPREIKLKNAARGLVSGPPPVPPKPSFLRPAIALTSSQAISTDPQPAGAVGMPPVYRADNRPPKTVLKQGFEPWVPFTLEESRDLILHFTGRKQLQNCSFKSKITLANNEPEAVGTPLDLKTLIITSKQRGPTVSTDPSKDCGGYADGRAYIYKIDCSHLKEVDWTTAIPKMTIRRNSLWPALLLDADTLDKATTIAFKSPGTTQEVTFLTPIPANKIALEQEPERHK